MPANARAQVEGRVFRHTSRKEGDADEKIRGGYRG